MIDLHIALGCTGGQLRSMVMANELHKRLPGKAFLYYCELRDGFGAEYA